MTYDIFSYIVTFSKKKAINKNLSIFLLISLYIALLQKEVIDKYIWPKNGILNDPRKHHLTPSISTVLSNPFPEVIGSFDNAYEFGLIF